MKTQSSGQNRNANAASKLEHVAERFQAFYNDLEQEKQQRRLSENARFHQLQDLLCKIERGLEAEVRRRSEADKKLQGHLDVELRRLQDRLSDEMREWQETMKASVDGLSKDVAAMQKSLRDEKEERDAEIESLTQSLSSRIEECTVGLEDERVSRLEREAQTLKRIGEDISRIQQRIDDDGSQRDAALVCVKNELKEATSRATGESKFQSTILEEMKSVRTSLKSETEARISEDDAIITAINEYTRALQQGLRLVCQ